MAKDETKKKPKASSLPSPSPVGQMLAGGDIPIGGTGAPLIPPEIWRLIKKPGDLTPAEQKALDDEKHYMQRLKSHGAG